MTNGGIGGMDLRYPDRDYKYRPDNETTEANQSETAETSATQPTLETQDPDAALAEEIAKTIQRQIIG